MTSLKGQVKYSCAAGRFEKRVEAEHVVVTGIKAFYRWNIFKTNVDVWSGSSKDTKNGKTEIFCFNHVYPGGGGNALEWQEGVSGSSMDSQKVP